MCLSIQFFMSFGLSAVKKRLRQGQRLMVGKILLVANGGQNVQIVLHKTK